VVAGHGRFKTPSGRADTRCVSEVTELIPTPAGSAGDGVDALGSSDVTAASVDVAAPPQIRPTLPTLPPRVPKTPAASPSAPAAESPSAPVSEQAPVPIPARAPTLLTAPPLVAPPLVAPPTGAPVLAAPTIHSEQGPADEHVASSPSGWPSGPAALPPPSSAPVAVDLPVPVSSAAAVSSPLGSSMPTGVDVPALPSLPTLGLAPASPRLAAMRLNLEPIEEVAARAVALSEVEQQSEDVSAPSRFTDGSAISMQAGAPGASSVTASDEAIAPDAEADVPRGPVVPTLASRARDTSATAGLDGLDGLDDLDEAAIEEAVEDALAVAAAKSGDPHLLAAAAHFAAQKQAAALPQVKGRAGKKQKRRRGRYVALAVLVVAASGSAYVFRESPIMQKARGVGYDPQALPGTVYERPVPGAVEVLFEITSVQRLASGEDVSIRTLTDFTANPTTGEGRYEGTRSVHPIVDGAPEREPASTETSELVRTGNAQYRRATTGSPGAWEVTPNAPGERGVGNLVFMYQDLVDESLRRVRPESVETSLDGDDTLTTYTWAIPAGEFYESAPQLSAVVEMLDGNTDPESVVNVVMTADASGVVRLVEVSLELDAVLSHTAAVRAVGTDIPYRYRWELTSMSDEAFVAAVPDGATPPVDPSLVPGVDPATDPAAIDPAAADPAAVESTAVPETVPVTAPVPPAGG
jgi:hypothetical protein